MRLPAERSARSSKPAAVFLAVGGIAASVPVLVWWAIGDVSSRHDAAGYFLVGPYQIGAVWGRVALWIAAVVLPVAVIDLIRRQRRGDFRWTGWVMIAWLAAAGALGAAGWRTITAGVDGANIGGDGAILLGPPAVTAFVMVAIWLPDKNQPVPIRRRAAWTAAAAALGAALFAVAYNLGPVVQDSGLITRQQYDSVHLGQTRSEIHRNLGGPESEESGLFFDPIPRGVKCEYYSTGFTTDPDNVQYQLCYRRNVLVSKRPNHALN
jgi:hypothetical protein